ncbi:MAG TPA: FAD-dependent monooxygenase [Streptosporangiaceae bacterium]
MNTGIQDATNLGWKLGLTTRGHAAPALLDTYEPERAPVGQMVRRFTDRVFTIATSQRLLPRLARTQLVPRLAPLAVRATPARAAVFRAVSELGIHYRNSPASTEGPHRPRRGPKAGDRLPDAPLARDDGQPTSLHAELAAPTYHLLLCGPAGRWPPETLAAFAEGWPGLLTVHRLTTGTTPGALHDPTGTALHRLGLDPHRATHYLVRPEGHIGYRATGTDPAGVHRYLARWLTPVADGGDADSLQERPLP